ncbi:hypothetical protein RchiOBHm_Chr2g0112681 [Rosa chinensis]|uniref:Uncharacterized protein n=1 Tax=Rosa chinensis TaxID=74649 RepID=A0A2P6RQF1_ROSCH|nr:hypothetical protein RchiOBHm_Chr2g0112681 [Rosa chinensis]
MAEEEHEVYGAEIPYEAEMDGNFDPHPDDDDMSTAVKEEEASALHGMQANGAKEMGAALDPATAADSQANKEAADECSVFVGNADCYSPTSLYIGAGNVTM